MSEAAQMFHWWHRVRDGTLDRVSFAAQRVEPEKRVGDLLRVGSLCDHPFWAKTCSNLLAVEVALWTFVRVFGVEPTNNVAERAVRSGVLWRKGRFGTHSDSGSRFVERMMTVVATLKQQKRHVLASLREACSSAIRGEKAPSLLPGATAQSQPTV